MASEEMPPGLKNFNVLNYQLASSVTLFCLTYCPPPGSQADGPGLLGVTLPAPLKAPPSHQVALPSTRPATEGLPQPPARHGPCVVTGCTLTHPRRVTAASLTCTMTRNSASYQ